jgi:predicted DNA-binding transcriptional regulator AlpA
VTTAVASSLDAKHDSQPTSPPALLTLALIRRFFLPLGERTIFRMISTGTFPKADLSMGSKLRMWKRETVEAWIEAQAGPA